MLSRATRMARLKRAEQESGACNCDVPIVDFYAANSCKELDEHERAARLPPCEAHPEAARKVVSFSNLRCDDPECTYEDCPTKQRELIVQARTLELAAVGSCSVSSVEAARALLQNPPAPRRHTGHGVQRPDRALPSGNERYLAAQRDVDGTTEAPQTPQDAPSAPDVPAYPLDPPPRSPPVSRPALSLPGRARDHVIDLAPISVGRINPSLLPECSACGHLASFHSEFRLGGTGCVVAGDLGGNGPCTCIAYNGPPPPERPTRVHALQLPGCTCGQYFGTCICDAASAFQQSNPKEYPK